MEETTPEDHEDHNMAEPQELVEPLHEKNSQRRTRNTRCTEVRRSR